MSSFDLFRASVRRAALVSIVAIQGAWVAVGGCAFPITVAAVTEESDGATGSIALAGPDADVAPRFAEDAAPQADADGGPADAPPLHDPTDPAIDASDGSG